MIDMANAKSSKELLEAQAHIWNHIFNFINSMSLKCAVELGIADIIHSHGKPITISELTTSLSIQPSKSHYLSRLLRILTHSGFFAKAKINKNGEEQEEEEEEKEGYVLTNSSKLLLKDNPLSTAPFLLAMLDPTMTKPWDYTSSWFFNQHSTPFGTAHGMTLWDCAGHHPKFNKVFNEAMGSDTKMLASVVVNEYKQVFDGLESLVDVGGGNGTLAKAITQAFPHLDYTVLDLPHVVDGFHSSSNLKFVAGNMFEAVPPADAILLKWILHDWSDEECVKILKSCKEAIKGRKGGKLIIIEMVISEKEKEKDAIETQLFFDMLMMILVNGKERNIKEWANLFYAAGFTSYKITPINNLRSIIEVYP